MPAAFNRGEGQVAPCAPPIHSFRFCRPGALDAEHRLTPSSECRRALPVALGYQAASEAQPGSSSALSSLNTTERKPPVQQTIAVDVVPLLMIAPTYRRMSNLADGHNPSGRTPPFLCEERLAFLKVRAGSKLKAMVVFCGA
jgi:hypothetical protein